MGSSIVEGTVGLLLVIGGAVMGTLLMVNSGIAMYYKQKLSFVTHEAAQAAVNQMVWNNAYRPGVSEGNVIAITKERVKSIAHQMGLPEPSNIDVTVSADSITVGATLSGLSLIGNGTILPCSLELSDKAVSLLTTSQPPATAVIRFGPDYSKAILVPSYGRYDPQISDGGRSAPSRQTGFNDGYAHLLGFSGPYYGSHVTLAEGNGQGCSFDYH